MKTSLAGCDEPQSQTSPIFLFPPTHAAPTTYRPFRLSLRPPSACPPDTMWLREGFARANLPRGKRTPYMMYGSPSVNSFLFNKSSRDFRTLVTEWVRYGRIYASPPPIGSAGEPAPAAWGAFAAVAGKCSTAQALAPWVVHSCLRPMPEVAITHEPVELPFGFVTADSTSTTNTSAAPFNETRRRGQCRLHWELPGAQRTELQCPPATAVRRQTPAGRCASARAKGPEWRLRCGLRPYRRP